MIWCVIWTVLMIFWLIHGSYTTWDPQRPIVLGSTLIPWACVLILGLILFGGLAPGPVAIR